MRGGFRGWRERYPTTAAEVADAVVRAGTDPGAGFRVLVGDDAIMLARDRDASGDEAWQDRLCRFLELDWPARPVIVVVAPAPFKGALSAAEAARAIGAGLRLAGAETRLAPVADGGEGTMDALVEAGGGRRRSFAVADPLGRPVDAALGLLPGGTAVVELAQASGWERLAPGERDAEATSTAGTGQLVRAALDLGATRVVVAVGGSATTDGGLGLARALGARLLDAGGAELEGRGADLGRGGAHRPLRPRPAAGRRGRRGGLRRAHPVPRARGGGPGLRAAEGRGCREAVERLDAGLAHLAGVLRAETGVDVQALPGAGAAGGAAGGMAALLGATLRPGADAGARGRAASRASWRARPCA